jgi:hypothetical protein
MLVIGTGTSTWLLYHPRLRLLTSASDGDRLTVRAAQKKTCLSYVTVLGDCPR